MKRRGTLGAMMAMCVAAAVPPSAEAAARVFVSVNGADAGNCADVNAPCRTLDFAIGAVDAGGEVIVLTTGSYAGATITKSVKIDAPTGVIAFSASPITVNAGATDVVVLRGLTLKAATPGVGSGIDFTNGSRLFVENCVLDGWHVGISVTGPNSHALVNGTTVRNGTGSGIEVSPTSGYASVSVEKSRLEGNSCGAAVSSAGATRSVRDSLASGNNGGFCASVGD